MVKAMQSQLQPGALAFDNEALTTSSGHSSGCGNPFCDTAIKPLAGRWRRTQRRFCSNHCKMIGWAIRTIAALLVPLGRDKAWEILTEVKQ